VRILEEYYIDFASSDNRGILFAFKDEPEGSFFGVVCHPFGLVSVHQLSWDDIDGSRHWWSLFRYHSDGRVVSMRRTTDRPYTKCGLSRVAGWFIKGELGHASQ
jgi:hypothetical protein